MDEKAVVNVVSAVNVANEVDPTLLLVSGKKQLDKEYIKKLANAILQVFFKYQIVRMRCVGAAAINNADKAIIIASAEASKKGCDIVERKCFTTVTFDGAEKTGILKTLEDYNSTE